MFQTNVMQKLVVFGVLILLGSCSTDKEHKDFQLADGTKAYTLRCPENWSGCHTSARTICGQRGYVEIDRFSAGSVNNAGRMHDPMNPSSEGSGVYKEDVRQDDYDRVLTIRCN